MGMWKNVLKIMGPPSEQRAMTIPNYADIEGLVTQKEIQGSSVSVTFSLSLIHI